MTNLQENITSPQSTGCEHPPLARALPTMSLKTLERAANIFQALGDPGRLRLLAVLAEEETCVSELAQLLDEEVSTISHRLRLLRSEGIIRRRRQGRHIYYSLLDEHVVSLLRNAFEHAEEDSSGKEQKENDHD